MTGGGHEHENSHGSGKVHEHGPGYHPQACLASEIQTSQYSRTLFEKLKPS